MLKFEVVLIDQNINLCKKKINLSSYKNLEMSSPALAAQQLTESQKPTSPSPQRLESKITPRLRLNGYSPKPESRNPTEHLMFYVFNSVASFIYLFIIYTVFLTKIFYCSQKDRSMLFNSHTTRP